MLTTACVIIICFQLTVVTAAISNPYTDPRSCNLGSKPAYICDADSVFEDKIRSDINAQLKSFNEDNVCRQCVAVAVIKEIQPNIPMAQAHSETNSLVQSLAAEQWRFPKCQSLAVLIVNTNQRYVWFEPGQGTKLCSSIGAIFGHNKMHFANGDYGSGVKAMIGTYRKGFEAKYESQRDCSLDQFPCGKDQKTLKELQSILSSGCRINQGDFVCDPEKALKKNDLKELQQTLKEVNSENKCGQCIIVALLNTARAAPQTLQRLAKELLNENIQHRGKKGECKAKLLILVAKEQGFTWIQGTEKTMFCSQLNDIFAANKEYFVSGDIHAGTMAIIASYHEAVAATKSCEEDVCSKSAAGGGTPPKDGKKNALNGIGDNVKDAASKFVMSHKMLILGLVFGILALLGCLFCVGCLCCRETMMSTVRSAGTAATKHGPRLLGGLTGRGRGGKGRSSGQYTAGDTGRDGTVTWGGGGSWKDTSDDGPRGGGGTWDDRGGQADVGYKDPYESRSRPSPYTGGGGGGGF